MTDIETHAAALKAEITTFQAAAVPATPKPHITFAGVWPTAREALTLLSSLVPGSIRMILSIVLMVGDQVAGHTTLAVAA